jgi:hypothetical protein
MRLLSDIQRAGEADQVAPKSEEWRRRTSLVRQRPISTGTSSDQVTNTLPFPSFSSLWNPILVPGGVTGSSSIGCDGQVAPPSTERVK